MTVNVIVNKCDDSVKNMATSCELQQQQLNKNYYLFISVRETKNITDKLKNIEFFLEEGADINFVDRNDHDSAPIHIAVRNSEPDVIQLLIKKGANLNLKNLRGETPLDIAQGLKTDKKQEIVNLLQAPNESKKQIAPIEIKQNTSQNSIAPIKILQNGSQNCVETQINTSKFRRKGTDEEYFHKRTGTSGASGHFYETKLLTLILLRALNSHTDAAGEEIEQFHIGTNINGIGDLDDICLRYRVKGHPNDIVLFLQAKHRENPEKGKITVEDLKSAAGDFSLLKYFDSYLKIKDKFQTKQIKNQTHTGHDVIFNGEFGNVECNLILYTSAKDFLAGEQIKIKNNEVGEKVHCVVNTGLEQTTKKKKTDKKVSRNVHYLINTGHERTTENKDIFQYNYDEDDIDYLTKITVIEQIKKLGFEFLSLIMSEADKSQVIFAAELIARYHVVMGRQVLQVSKDQQQNDDLNRMWEFRPDFFTSDCEYLVTLRHTFCKLLSTTRCDRSKVEAEDKEKFMLILRKPTASIISTLIGKLVTYDEKTKMIQLIHVNEFRVMFEVDELEQLPNLLNKIGPINENVIKEAIQIKLVSLKFKLPRAFGNLDMTINDKKKDRVSIIADKLIKLFLNNKDDKNTVEINEEIVGSGKALEKGIIGTNGGIGSAVGNLLVFETQTKMMKFDMENKALPTKAASLLNELKHPRHYPTNEELSSYRIKINIGGFPKDSFHGNEFDKRQAKDFLCKLWFYTNQAKENEVECIIKNGINEHYNHERIQNQFKLRIHTDSIFLRSHDEIQKWRMHKGETRFLTRKDDIFEHAMIAIVESPLMLTALDYMYNLELHDIGIKFNQDAIRALELDKNTEKLFFVITDALDLSAIKIIQHFETLSLQNKFTFIQFDYALSLPLDDYNTMLKELEQTKIETLILIYENRKYYKELCNKLKAVIKLFKGKIVLVTESVPANEILKYIGVKYHSVKDVKTCLVDLVESSQTKVLEESTIEFQGQELPLISVLDQDARSFVRTEMLYKIINGEKIELGYPLMDQVYQDLNNFIERKLCGKPVNTLQDIDDKVVVMSGRPGTGKSALLTHLSLRTKQLDPLPWIVRVNLKGYIKEFEKWQVQYSTISTAIVLHFLCNIALKNTHAQMKTELSYLDGKVTVKHFDSDIDPLSLFETELFLHLYNSGQIVFLFDDFSAMYPRYDSVVLQMLKILKNENKRVWVTTFPSKYTRIPLENELGICYELEPLNTKENYLDQLFSQVELRPNLAELDYDPSDEDMRLFVAFLPKFLNLIKDPDRALPAINWLAALSVHETVTQFIWEMKNNRNVIWNSIEYFIESYIKKIFFQDDVENEFLRTTFQSTRREFFDKHKKLGLVTYCNQVKCLSNYLDKLLESDELKEVHYTKLRISNLKERTNIINWFVSYLFREYFAVECLTDMMKSLAEDKEPQMNPLKNATLWQSIMNILLFEAPPDLRRRFDYKLQSDSSLAELVNSPTCCEVVFELLLKQGRVAEMRNESGKARSTPVSNAIEEGFNNIANLLLSSIQLNLNQGNVDEILRLLIHSRDKFAEFGKDYDETFKSVLESVRDMNIGRLGNILKSGRLTDVPLRHANGLATASELHEHTIKITALLSELLEVIKKLWHQADDIGYTSLTEYIEALLNDALAL